MARRDRDADAGIAGELMAMTVERRPQRLIDPRHQRVNILGAFDAVLKDGELIPTEARDEVPGSGRLAQPIRDALQELVTDQMPQRIVDALELVDVDVEDCELDALSFQQQFLCVALKQRPVRQVGKRVVMGEMFDLCLDPTPLGHVFHRRGPATARRPLGYQPDGTPVRGRGDDILHTELGIEKFGAIGLHVADEGAEFLAVKDKVAQMAAGLGDFRRDAEHVDVLPIADDEMALGIEQQEALGHVVDGSVEMLGLLRQPQLRGGVLAAQLTHDQEHHANHDNDRQGRGTKLQAGLRPPVGQHGRRLGSSRRRRSESAPAI